MEGDICMLDDKKEPKRKKKNIGIFRTGDFSDADFFSPNPGLMFLLGGILFVLLVIAIVLREVYDLK